MYTQDSISVTPDAVEYIRGHGGFAVVEAHRAVAAG